MGLITKNTHTLPHPPATINLSDRLLRAHKKGKVNPMETTDISKTAHQYIKTREAIESATIALAELEEQLREYFTTTGNETIDVDGKTIKIVHNHRRVFDVSALKNLVSPTLFRKVTEPTVKTKLWDSALALGKIDNSVVEQVVSITQYDQLRVK